MKHEKFLSFLFGTLLSFGIALSGIFCMITGLGVFPDDEQMLVLICAAAAVISCICFSFRHGGAVLLASAALLLGFWIREGTLLLQIESLLYQITRLYDRGYGWGYICWSEEPPTDVSLTGGLVVAAIFVILAVSWVMIRKKNELFALIAGFLPLASCIVVTDTIPDEKPLFWLIACLVTLLLTHPVRRKNPAGAIRLTAILLIPVLLLCSLLFAVIPQATFGSQMSQLQLQLIDWFNDLPFIPGYGPSVDGLPADSMNLAAVGPKLEQKYATMDVRSEHTQTLYLRAQSFDTYNGLSWTASPSSTGIDPYWPSIDLERMGKVQISTRSQHPQIYFPYYISTDDWDYDFVNGKYENAGGERTYSYSQYATIPGVSRMSAKPDYSSGILKQCLELPWKTRIQAEQILQRIGIQGGSNAEIAEMISQYVRGSAMYDLNTPKIPSDENDFAIWFLEESETGYCVHFASAAAVLLRAAGIPARYVSGYAFSVQAGIRKTVTSDRAHAWVEYLDPELGWQVLDATPGEALIEPETEPTQATKPTQTKPTETEPTETEPTDTTGTRPPVTKPSNSTEPTATTPSTEPTETQQAAAPGSEKQEWPSWLKPTLHTAFWIVLTCALLFAQYRLRIAFWKKRMYTGPANRQALCRWRYLRRIQWAVGKKPPKMLAELAEKAAFSQHTLTEEELQHFTSWMQEAILSLRTQPWIWRGILKLIFAIP